MLGMHRLMTIFMFIAVFSLLTTSLSYNPQEAYASVTSGVSTTGFQIVADPTLAPINGQVGEDSQQDSTVFAFDEKTDFELPVDIDLDLSAMDGVTSVAAGTVISSTTVVFDPPTTSLTSTQGCVSFDGQDVLGIQFESQTLIDSDPILGHPDVTYLGPEFRGIEPPPHNNADQVFFVGPKICFVLKASTPGDTFRVITTSEHVSTLLWQIGVFDQDRTDLTTSNANIPIIDYNADDNPINNCGGIAADQCIDPEFPALIGDRTTSPKGQTTSIDISFTSESCSEAILIYSRAGMEEEQILLNDTPVETDDPIASAENVWKTIHIPLGPLEAGLNVITIDYIEENSPDGIHAVDALALVCWEDAVPPQVICEPDTMDLIAGQTIDSGDVTLINDGTTLLITIQTQDDWQLSESHVQIGETLDDFPLTKKGNPKVGNFDYQREYNPLVTEDTYEFLLADLGLESGDTIIFAVHTVVVQTDSDGEVIAEETAWKQGERFVEKGNWAMYNMYDIQECDVIE